MQSLVVCIPAKCITGIFQANEHLELLISHLLLQRDVSTINLKNAVNVCNVACSFVEGLQQDPLEFYESGCLTSILMKTGMECELEISISETCQFCNKGTQDLSKFKAVSLPVNENEKGQLISEKLEAYLRGMIPKCCDECDPNYIVSHPDLLVIGLSRSNGSHYIDCCVEPEKSFTFSQVHYSLRAVVVRVGSELVNGHFIAHIKTRDKDTVVMDDYHVYTIQDGISDETIRRHGYIFFYMKENVTSKSGMAEDCSAIHE